MRYATGLILALCLLGCTDLEDGAEGDDGGALHVSDDAGTQGHDAGRDAFAPAPEPDAASHDAAEADEADEADDDAGLDTPWDGCADICNERPHGLRRCGIREVIATCSVDCGSCTGAESCQEVFGEPLCVQCKQGDDAVYAADVVLDFETTFDVWGLAEQLIGVREITGDLTISLDEALIDTLPALSCLQRVGGDVSINARASSVQDLAGLSALTEIGGGLLILGHEGLQTLNGLSQLQTIGGSVALVGGVYESLAGLQALHTIAGGLTISGVPLQDLSGLQALQQMDGPLVIQHASVTNLSGLDGVEGISELRLHDLPNLTALATLPASTYTHLSILRAPKLTTLEGLQAATSLGELWLTELPALTSLEALASVQEIAGALWLTDLPAVSTLALSALTHVGGVLGLERTGLTDLQGLQNASGYTGVSLWHNAQLQSLQGLAGLEHVEDVLVLDHPLLQDVSAMHSLPAQLRELTLQELPMLTSLEGLHNVQHSQHLDVIDLPALLDLKGLRGLQRVDETVRLVRLASLASIEDLSGLAQVQTLFVAGLSSLQTLHGLEGLRTVSGSGAAGANAPSWAVRLQDNAMLHDISALSQITALGGVLQVVDNPALSQCSLQALAQGLGGSCACPYGGYVNVSSPNLCECTAECACTGNDNSEGACL